MLTRSHVELIDIPQRMGASRKNAADIKMAVDALELAFERDYISTFVLCTGDSDFTPLVHKLRELNKRVIGVGVEKTTSALLPPACDEFLYYDRLEGVEIPPARTRRGPAGPTRGDGAAADRGGARTPAGRRRIGAAMSTRSPPSSPRPWPVFSAAPAARSPRRRSSAPCSGRTRPSTSPTTGSAPSASCCATSPSSNVVELVEGPAKGDPEVTLPEHGDREAAFSLLRAVVADLAGERRLGGAVRSEESAAQGAARLQREEARLPQLSPVLQGGRDQREWSSCGGAPTPTTTCSARGLIPERRPDRTVRGRRDATGAGQLHRLSRQPGGGSAMID